MTEALPEQHPGEVFARVAALARGKDVVALGPGLGTAPDTVALVRRLVRELPQPMVIDADALNALAGSDFAGEGRVRILTPHPGEMARLTGSTTAQVQADRVGAARDFAHERRVTLVLKGQRTLIAYPDGRVSVNPTGTPALATGGSGDILTGTIAALVAQFPEETDRAVAAAVYLHGLAGQLGAAELGEKSLIATDLLRYYPAAIHACL
jgi:NAD(P)H-hydrate epimerase